MHEKPNQYTVPEQLEDRVRHSLVFSQACTRALEDALVLLLAEKKIADSWPQRNEGERS